MVEMRESMKKDFKKVYQFKIQLLEISPPIWRRIQVPETYSFWDLHVAFQDAMGWLDYHLHEFRMKNPDTQEIQLIGMPDEDFPDERDILEERHEKIPKWFSMENRDAEYEYDFGDGWRHRIELEKILSREQGKEYPLCLIGKRACPPEDCGGVPGYENLLEVIGDPSHPEYHDMVTWIGDKYSPDHFDADEINFDDPDERWVIANSG